MFYGAEKNKRPLNDESPQLSMTKMLKLQLDAITRNPDTPNIWTEGKRKRYVKTCIADQCIAFLRDKIDIHSFDAILDPCYRNQEFVDPLLEKHSVDPKKLIYIDEDAKDAPHKMDFLSSFDILDHDLKEPKLCLTIGVPPIGKGLHDVILYFNKAAQFSSVIAFIVPKTFSNPQTCNKLDPNFFLFDEKHVTDHHFHDENGRFEINKHTYGTHCSFQIWVHSTFNEKLKTPLELPPSKLRAPLNSIYETPDFVITGVFSTPELAIKKKGKSIGRVFTSSKCPHGKYHFCLMTQPVTLDRGKIATNVIFTGPSKPQLMFSDDDYAFNHKSLFIFIKLKDPSTLESTLASLLSLHLDSSPSTRFISHSDLCQLYIQKSIK